MSEPKALPLGPAMIDVSGTALSADDRRRLLNPLVGGVILFAHNYENPEQLCSLTAEIHALRNPPLLIAVDHEGGRVQRLDKVSPRSRRCGCSVSYVTRVGSSAHRRWRGKSVMSWPQNSARTGSI